MSMTNNPPSPLDFAVDVIKELSEWMSGNPVVQTEDEARQAKLLLDRAKAALEDVERERADKVRPLNDQVASINLTYKAAHNTDHKKPGVLDKIVLALKQRVQSYLLIEESKRRRIAEEKAAAADAAREAALKAEALEREAKENAAAGEVGIDIGKRVEAADLAFAEFEKAARASALADREAEKTKLAGGFAKSISVRTVEVLEIMGPVGACEAIVDMGLTDGIRDAILTSARSFRVATGDLPHGISIKFERKL